MISVRICHAHRNDFLLICSVSFPNANSKYDRQNDGIVDWVQFVSALSNEFFFFFLKMHLIRSNVYLCTKNAYEVRALENWLATKHVAYFRSFLSFHKENNINLVQRAWNWIAKITSFFFFVAQNWWNHIYSQQCTQIQFIELCILFLQWSIFFMLAYVSYFSCCISQSKRYYFAMATNAYQVLLIMLFGFGNYSIQSASFHRNLKLHLSLTIATLPRLYSLHMFLWQTVTFKVECDMLISNSTICI